MTPVSLPAQVVFTFDAKGRSTSSVTGSASMSARRATTRPGLPPLQQRNDAGVRHPGMDLEPERPEMFGHNARGAEFAVAEFGIPMDAMLSFDHFRFELVSQPVEIGPDVGRETAGGKIRQEGGDKA